MLNFSVAEKVCSQKHIIQGHLLAAKPLRGEQLIDVRCDPEHVGNSWTTVEVIVGQELKNEMFYRRHFETCTHSGLVEEIILKRNEGKILVTFNNFEGIFYILPLLSCKQFFMFTDARFIYLMLLHASTIKIITKTNWEKLIWKHACARVSGTWYIFLLFLKLLNSDKKTFQFFLWRNILKCRTNIPGRLNTVFKKIV